MKTTSRIALNAVSNWFGIIVHSAIGIALIPFLISKLGKPGYGLISLVGAIVGLTTLADLGLRSGLTRLLSEQVAKKNCRRFNDIFNTGLAAYTLIGGVCTTYIIVFPHTIASLFNVSSDMLPQAVMLIRWYGSLAVFLSFLNPAFGAVLASHNRYDINNYIFSIQQSTQGILLFLVLHATGLQFKGWIIVSIVTHISATVMRSFFSFRVHSHLTISLSHIQAHAFRAMLSLGGKMYILQTVRMLSIHADPFVIAHFFGPAGVALYHPATVLPKLARKFVNTMSSQLDPITTSLHVTNQRQRLHEVLIRGTRYTFLAGILASTILGIFSGAIMKVWLQPKFGDEFVIAGYILLGWAITDLSQYAGGCQWPVLLGMNRLAFFIWFQAISSIVNIALSIYFVGYTSLGIAGVVLPTAAIALVRRPVIAWHTARLSGISGWLYFKHSYAKPLAVLFLTAGFSYLFLRFFPLSSIIELAIAIAGVTALWGLATWYIGLNELERKKIIQLTKSKLSALSAARYALAHKQPASSE